MDGELYGFNALPMGLTVFIIHYMLYYMCFVQCSPRVFTRLIKFISQLFRKQGIQVSNIFFMVYKLYISVQVIFYINNILVIGITKAYHREKVIYVAKVLGNLGFLLNLAKISTEPSQVITYLGFIWDLRSWMVSLKPSREVKIRKLAAKL